MRKKHRKLNILFNIIFIFALSIMGLLIYRNVCYDKFYVSGSSMEPTLSDLEYGYIKTTSGAKKNIKRFDIVVVDAQDKNGEITTIIKRVIGLPGETINIIKATGELKINGQIVEQKFITDANKANTCQGSLLLACDNDFVVPDKEVYVLGDNRLVSLDSERKYGPLPYANIIGVLTVIHQKCESEGKSCKLITPRFF